MPSMLHEKKLLNFLKGEADQQILLNTNMNSASGSQFQTHWFLQEMLIKNINKVVMKTSLNKD